jgi:carboxyl-terminal processing protease
VAPSYAESNISGVHLRIRLIVRPVTVLFVTILLVPAGRAQETMTRLEREQRQAMLRTVFDDVRNDYYDPKIHGLDWNAKFAEAQANIAKATSKTEANFQIAALLETLNDSHTSFIPPSHSVREDYGWHYQVIGERCYVTRVRPGSDAESKGLKPGDEVLTVNGFTPARESLEKMQYVLQVLYPQTGLRVELRDQSGKVRKVDVMAAQRETELIRGRTTLDTQRMRIEREQSAYASRPVFQEFGDPLIVLKLPAFFQTKFKVEDLVEKARLHGTLIVDLRGNRGGAEITLKDLLGGMFQEDVKIADEVKRTKTTPVIVKGKHKSAFTGKLIVLVDSRSASAAEIFARTVQIEKRGIVLGDLTSGSVMAAQYHPHEYGVNPVIVYGVMVSVADFIMADGKSLEHTGVRPDETMLPSKEDLLAGRDPVMARAAEMAGVVLTPEKAAEMFPYEWPKL